MNPTVSNGNKLKWKFEDVDKLTHEGEDSDTFTFQGVYWKIHACRLYSNKDAIVCIYLQYDSENKNEKTWICETKRESKILNQNDNAQNWTSSNSSIFDSSYRIIQLTSLERTILNSEGYVKDNSITVEIELDFKYYDFSKNIPNHTDIIFNVKNTKFFVNKEILCSESEYFHNKFFVENSDEKELTIIAVDIDDFRCFIASICLFFETVNDCNYEELMELAAKYKSPRLHKNCENVLISEVFLQLEKMIQYADKHDYNRLREMSIDLITTTAPIEKIQKLMELKNLKDTTKRDIEKKMLENESKSQNQLHGVVEKHLKCQNCSAIDSKENVNICQTCDERKLEYFENEDEILKLAICSICTVKKHIRQGHVTIDFFPLFLDYTLKYEMKKVQVTLQNFENMKNIRKGEEQTWKTLSEAAETKFDEFIDITRQSKSTKNLQQNVDDINSFIETTTNQTESYVEIMRAQTLLIQDKLQMMEEWMNEKRKQCVKDKETDKLLPVQNGAAIEKANE